MDYYKSFLELFDPKNRGFVKPAEIEAALIASGHLDEKNAIMELF